MTIFPWKGCFHSRFRNIIFAEFMWKILSFWIFTTWKQLKIKKRMNGRKSRISQPGHNAANVDFCLLCLKMSLTFPMQYQINTHTVAYFLFCSVFFNCTLHASPCTTYSRLDNFFGGVWLLHCTMPSPSIWPPPGRGSLGGGVTVGGGGS